MRIGLGWVRFVVLMCVVVWFMAYGGAGFIPVVYIGFCRATAAFN